MNLLWLLIAPLVVIFESSRGWAAAKYPREAALTGRI